MSVHQRLNLDLSSVSCGKGLFRDSRLSRMALRRPANVGSALAGLTGSDWTDKVDIGRVCFVLIFDGTGVLVIAVISMDDSVEEDEEVDDDVDE